MQGYLYIHLDHLHIRNLREITDEYLSFLWEDTFHFSNAYSHQQLVDYSIPLDHSLLLPVAQKPFQNIMLQVWEHHMILFEH
jgi:hypothetical protein